MLVREALSDRLGPKSREQIKQDINDVIKKDPIKGYFLAKENNYEKGIEKSFDLIKKNSRLLSIYLDREVEDLSVNDINIQRDGTIVIKGYDIENIGRFVEEEINIEKLNISNRSRFEKNWKVKLKPSSNPNEYNLKFEEIMTNKEIPNLKSKFQYTDKIKNPFKDLYENLDKYFIQADDFHKKELKEFIEKI